MDRGHIKLWRKLIDEEVFYKPEHLMVFLYIIIKAAWKPKKYRGVDLLRGQIVTGRKALAKEVELSESMTYSVLKWLKTKQYINITSYNKYSVITVCNYNTYQDVDFSKSHQSHIKVTSKSQQSLTIEEVKALEALKKKNLYDKSRLEFDIFRKNYLGTKRGLDTEFEHFKKQCKDFKSIVLILNDKLQKEISHKEALKKSNEFCPDWKHLKTWINNKCWENEYPDVIVEKQKSNDAKDMYRPI